MAAGSERHRLLVVHRHAGKCLAHLGRRLQGIGLGVHALRINIDEAHLHGGQRVLHRRRRVDVRVALVARRQPNFLGAPVDILLGMPDIGAAEPESESLQAHRFIGDIAGQDDQVGPAELVAVLLLDRPEQTARLVQAHIVWPGVQRRETLVARAAAAATIGDAIRSGSVPGHADHQPAVMTPVRRPPWLAVGHQRVQVLLQRADVELLDLLAIVEVTAHRIGLGVVLMQDVEVERVRPPIHVRLVDEGHAPMHHRAFAGGRHAVCVHDALRLWPFLLWRRKPTPWPATRHQPAGESSLNRKFPTIERS